jgi:hypothetical protein
MNLAGLIDEAVNDGLLEHAKRLVRSVDREQACQALDECRRLAMLTFNNQRTNSNRALLAAGMPLGEAWSARRHRELDELRTVARCEDPPPT